MILVTMRVDIAVLMVPNPMIVMGVLIIVVEVFMLVMGVFMDLMGMLVFVMGVLVNLFDLAGMFEYVIHFLGKVILIVRSIVRSPGVDIEFDAGDSSARLPLKMQVAIAKVQFCKLPFEGGRGDPQIGQGANRHVAANPRKAVQVENTHAGLPTLKTARCTRVALRVGDAF
jgi:hypothetical protein